MNNELLRALSYVRALYRTSGSSWGFGKTPARQSLRVMCCWLLVICCLMLVVDCSLLVVGRLLLIVGWWLLVGGWVLGVWC